MTPILVAIIAVLLALSARRFIKIARIGAGYKAKALCSALFVSKLPLDLNGAAEVSADAYWLMRLFPARVDAVERSVTTCFLGIRLRTAYYRTGYGASLGLTPRAKAQKPPPQCPGLDIRIPWPLGEGAAALAPADLDRVVASAFNEQNAGRLKRTRAVLVVQGGRLIAERYAPGISAATRLNGWSMSKGVLGTLMGTLVNGGAFRLDSRALLPQWSTPEDPRAAISLEDLLRMRSGLRFSEKYSDPLSDVTRMLFDQADAGGFAAARPFEHPAGAHWQYASGTTNILSLVARHALGEEAYASWPRRALFDPAGMRSAVFETDATGTFVGSSFLFATARDWARFGLLMLQHGRWNETQLIPSDWVKLMTTATSQSPDARYGAHWWLKLSPELGGETPAARQIPADAYHALGHEGQCLTVIPSRDLVVLRLGLSIDITAWNHASFMSDLLDVV